MLDQITTLQIFENWSDSHRNSNVHEAKYLWKDVKFWQTSYWPNFLSQNVGMFYFKPRSFNWSERAIPDPDSGSGSFQNLKNPKIFLFYRYTVQLWIMPCTLLHYPTCSGTFFEGKFTSFFKDKKISHKTEGIEVFLTIFAGWYKDPIRNSD